MIDIIVIGAGPAGVLAALRAADLGAGTMLVTRAEFGGMAGNDGPIPVRTLAHAARLIREARQLGQYGIGVSEPVLDYPRLLARVREVVKDARAHSSLRRQIDSLGVTVHEHAGVARFGWKSGAGKGQTALYAPLRRRTDDPAHFVQECDLLAMRSDRTASREARPFSRRRRRDSRFSYPASRALLLATLFIDTDLVDGAVPCLRHNT